VDNSNNLKVAVGLERSLQGSRSTNDVPPPTIEEVHESGTRWGVLMKVKPWGISSNSLAEVVLGGIQVLVRAKLSMLWVSAKSAIAVEWRGLVKDLIYVICQFLLSGVHDKSLQGRWTEQQRNVGLQH